MFDGLRMRRRPLLQPRLVRVPPARDQVLDRDPGGVMGDCGSMEIFCVSLAAEPLGNADSDVVVGTVDAANFALDKLVPQLEEAAPEA